MDWNVFATITAPIFALPVGAVLNRIIERQMKLVSFISHASAIPVRPPEGQAFQVNTHTIVVRNAGKLTATNVRLGHAVLPQNFGVWPNVAYEVKRHEDGSAELLFPQLIPNEQVTITYLYNLPILWNQVNSYTKCDQGFAKILSVIPWQAPPKWATRLAAIFMLIGLSTVLYFLWQQVGMPIFSRIVR
jgi:uncharacterized repeat protein (TIGR01451 family)